VSQFPELKIPFLGVLGTRFSAQALGFARQLLGYLLFGVALLLYCFYLAPHARGMFQALPSSWRQTLLTIALSLVLVPLLVILLIVSLVGIFALPLVALALAAMAFDGLLALCARAGAWLRRGAAEKGGGESLFLFTSGLLGLFLLKMPSLVGILLTVLRPAIAVKIGEILQAVGLAATAAGLAYGFGATLAYARSRAAR